MKVLMLLHNLRMADGVASFVMNYFSAIDHNKIHMDFAIWKDITTPYYSEIEKRGAKVFILPSLKNFSQHITACEKIIRNGHYDIIHDNTLLISFPIMFLAMKFQVPVRLLHSHSSRLGENRLKEIRNKSFLPLLKVAVNNYAACSKVAAEAMIGDAHYFFIPNIIQSNRFRYSEHIRNNLKLQMNIKDKIIIGTVGRVVAAKNPFFAVAVMEKLIKKDARVEYWWIGSGAMESQLNKRVQQSDFADHIHLLGDRPDVTDLYQVLDVLFLPSLFEGLPITGVEAQAMGLPVVASETITKEMMYTDLVSFVSLDAPIEEWVATIERQIERIPKRHSYAIELTKSVFSDKNAGQRLEELYEQLLTK